MSLEESIAHHSVALQNLADAIRYHADQTATRSPAQMGPVGSGTQTDPKALQKEVVNMGVEASAQQKAAMAAVEKDRKDAKAEKEAAPVADPVDDPLDAAPLDWDKDVRPALLAVGKDRDALVKLMAKYEVPKGGKAPAEKWADLLAGANAIVAARG